MTINLIRLAVGCGDIAELSQRQSVRESEYRGERAVPAFTRRAPVRQGELLDGGSLYWVIKSHIMCRQEILGFEQFEDESHGTYCMIMLRADIMKLRPIHKRPFQGWRYLKPSDAPRDDRLFDPDEDIDELPPEMEADLRESGLL